MKKRLDRTLQALNTKPLPRNAEQLFKNYADLFFNRHMPKGGVGRKRNMGDLRAFLNWAVLEKKYLGVEWLPLTAKQYAKYVGAVPKGRKKNRTREPILTADFEMLLEALKRENKLGLRAICVLSGVYGIRISEIANMKIKDGKVEEAQLIYDLKKEMGFKNEYFENKISYLFKYTDKADEIISEKTIFDFHLAHKTNPNFKFRPDEKTSKIIWKYLSSANLLTSFKEIKITDLDKISNIERAVHNKNYSENELFKIYMRFQFSINQLLDAKEAYKSLNNIEARALLYQKILLESEMIEKLKLPEELLNTPFNISL